MSNLPKTYKALRQEVKGKPFVLVDVEMKKPGDGEIVVKVLACGVCHSDAVVKYEIMSALPRIPGHELIGEVVAVGAGVHHIKVGEIYGGGWHGFQCGECTQCRKGDFVTCEKEGVNGVTRDGGYAQYATLQAAAAVKIPKGIDYAEACPQLCAGVTVFNSIRNMGVKSGGLVAIQGLGGLGHLGVQFAAKMGYLVAALSRSDAKEKFAKDLGAHHYLDSSKESHAEGLQKLGGADLVVCTAPSSEIIPELIKGLGVNGTLLILALPDKPLEGIDVVPMIQKRLKIRGWPSGQASDTEETVKFALDHNVRCLIEKYPLAKGDEAFEAMIKGTVRFRAVLIPDHAH